MSDKQKESNQDKIAGQDASCDCAADARDEKISELDILKQSLEEIKKQKEDYYDQLLRLQADFANYRRRSEEEKKKYLEWGKEKILVRQIQFNDILEQALKSAKSGGKTEDIITGLEMIVREFAKMLKEEGVEEIKIKKFDPNVCEALDTCECGEEDGKILEVYQKGYKINGNLARTAKVKVAKRCYNDGVKSEE